MTNEDQDLMELRIRVAELRGKHVYTGDELQRMCDVCGENPSTETHRITDYPNDLNACHEFEESLTEEERTQYQDALADIVITELPQGRRITGFDLIHATATQRCRAFVALHDADSGRKTK